MIPKIQRDSSLFDASTADKINKKVSLLENNISALEVPTLDPKVDLHGLMISPVESITDSEYWEETDEYGNVIDSGTTHTTYKGVLHITDNNSFVIGNSGNLLKILCFTLTVDLSLTNDDGSMLPVASIPYSPLTDVWFAAKDGTAFMHIPQGSTTIYWLANGSQSIDVYTWYI